MLTAKGRDAEVAKGLAVGADATSPSRSPPGSWWPRGRRGCSRNAVSPTGPGHAALAVAVAARGCLALARRSAVGAGLLSRSASGERDVLRAGGAVRRRRSCVVGRWSLGGAGRSGRSLSRAATVTPPRRWPPDVRLSRRRSTPAHRLPPTGRRSCGDLAAAVNELADRHEAAADVRRGTRRAARRPARERNRLAALMAELTVAGAGVQRGRADPALQRRRPRPARRPEAGRPAGGSSAWAGRCSASRPQPGRARARPDRAGSATAPAATTTGGGAAAAGAGGAGRRRGGGYDRLRTHGGGPDRP